MNNQELIQLRSKVKDAASDLDAAIFNARSALEDLQVYYDNRSEPEEKFTWLIEKGFVPGAEFRLSRKDKPVLQLTVKGYSYLRLNRSGASVVFAWVENGEEKKSSLLKHLLERNLDDFAEVKS